MHRLFWLLCLLWLSCPGYANHLHDRRFSKLSALFLLNVPSKYPGEDDNRDYYSQGNADKEGSNGYTSQGESNNNRRNSGNNVNTYKTGNNYDEAYNRDKNYRNEMYDNSNENPPPYPADRPPYPAGREPTDIITSYTNTFTSRVVVSASSALCSGMLSILLANMLLGTSHRMIPLVIGSASCIGCYIPRRNNFGNLSRALGIFLILLIRRAKFSTFLLQFTKQFQAILMLKNRAIFPASENPWSYSPRPNTNDVPFNMMSALIGIVLAGGWIGWACVKPIPLFPNWIGAISGAAFFGYLGTLKDTKGDLLRFLGFSLNRCMSHILSAASEVGLKEKLNVFLSNAFALLLRLDKQFGIITKIQFLLIQLVGFIKNFTSNVKADMETQKDNRYKEEARGTDYSDGQAKWAR